MARPLRIEFPGALHHVTVRSNARQPVFRSDEDRLLYLDILARTVDRWGWICHAYCLTDVRCDLLVETPEPNLSRGMRQLGGEYTQAFNRRHGQRGHIFEGRFASVVAEKENWLLELARHVVLIPVRAGLARREKDWSWSSYRATAGRAAIPAFLTVTGVLDRMGKGAKERQRRYRRFVKEGRKSGSSPCDAPAGLWLGGEDFGVRIRELIRRRRAEGDLPRSQRRIGGSRLEDFLPKKVRKSREERNRAILKAYREGRYTQKEIGDFLGLHHVTVSRIVRDEEGRIGEAP